MRRGVDGGAAAEAGAVIRDDVVAGRLAPGQRLSESELSRRLGVSRSPIREALASLERDGLVERRGPAAYVRERTQEEVLDIYAVRSWVEGMIAAHAAERRSADDVRRLDAALAFGRAVEETDSAELVRANRAFHDALAHASHHQTLVEIQRRLTDQVAAMPATTLSAPGRWVVAVREHAEIAEAVGVRDVERARALAEQHMTTARNIRVRLYAEQAQHELHGPGSAR